MVSPIDPSISHFPPNLSNQQGSSLETLNQNTDVSLNEKNIEAIVSKIILSNFSEVMNILTVPSWNYLFVRLDLGLIAQNTYELRVEHNYTLEPSIWSMD